MSRFSGKCDLYDSLCITGNGDVKKGFEKFKGTHLFIGDKEHPLEYSTLKDLVPYFPYIETVAFVDNKDSNNSMIILSEKSWVDIQYERYGISKKYYQEELEKEIKKYENEK